ncbi:acyl-CoA N-acyltransferase [Delitschia confertaspora ATCC 74209]|uniref:Acyl-CoA N-acyltransferase n=1 Tax=Delitschia confertaspora ATCC 74209 TaxID=1513339 RepID=A0A9P4JXW3_9PLEO|nr:acyl-CoA N-acyltransferase [Delitschia confertaspora ATCC 74209]
MSPYLLSEAAETDACDIATLFSLSWTSPFTRLQFGNIDPDVLAESMTPRIKEQIEKHGTRYIVVRDDKEKVISCAQWTIPIDEEGIPEEDVKETVQDQEERQQMEDEVFRKNLPENSNKDLIVDFMTGVRELRKRAVAGRKHYALENIATHPSYRGQGLASKLVQWSFAKADGQNSLVYLDTASDNTAMKLYKKLGFKEVGSHTIEDLSKYGGEGSETHIAFLRYPSS